MNISWKSMLASLLAILLAFSPIGTFNTFAVEDESATFEELTVNDKVVDWGKLAINEEVVNWLLNGDQPMKLAAEEGLDGLGYWDSTGMDFTLTHELSDLEPGIYRVSVKTHNDELGPESGSEMFVKTIKGEYEKAITSMDSKWDTPATLTLGGIEVGDDGKATIGFTIKADSEHYGYLKDIEFVNVNENETVPTPTIYNQLKVNDKAVGWSFTGKWPATFNDKDDSGGLGYWDSTGMDFTLTHELTNIEPGIYRVSVKTGNGLTGLTSESKMFVKTNKGNYEKEIPSMGSEWGAHATLTLDGIEVGEDRKATIGFTIKADGDHYGYLKDIEFVNEAAPTISALKLSPNSMILRPGKSMTITHQGQGITQYKSSNEQVATVDTAGIVTAVGNGSAVITATIEVEEGVMLVGQTDVFVSGSLQKELDGFPLFVKPIPELQGNKRNDFIMGADISTVLEIEKSGRKYYDLDGIEKPLMKVLKENGVNWIRLRIWNDPKDEKGNWYGAGNTDQDKVIKMAEQAKAHGLQVLVDFHYSDFWADPARQTIPKEWANFSEAELEKAVYEYTYDVIQSLDAVGAYPDMVQIGNEINSGMLWPKGKTPEGAKKYIESGIKAVRDAETGGKRIKVLIHRADPQDGLEKLTEFYEVYKDLDYDVIGLSYYPFYHGTIDNIKTVMDGLAEKFDKEIVIAETSYAYTLEDPINNGPTGHTFNEGSAVNGGYLPTVTGQATVIRDVIAAVAEVPGNKGLGMFYWEPAWLPGTDTGWGTTYAAGYQGETISADGGSGWSNQALFNYFGEALPSIKVFNLVRGEGINYIEPNLIKVNDIQVTTNEGINVPLPMAIKGLFTDGAYRNVAVKSWTPSEYNYNSAGTYTAKASLQEGQSATATITVRPRNYVKNADIESDDLSDWTLNGVTRTSDASFNGQYSLNFWDKALVEAGQKITGLPKGIYQLSMQTRIGLEKPIAASSHMYALTSKERKEVKLYATGWDRWANMVIEGIEVTDGTLEIGVEIKDAIEAYGNFDEWQLIRTVDLETGVEPEKPGTGDGSNPDSGNGSNPDSGNSSNPDNVNGQNPEDETVITPNLELDVNGMITLKVKENQQLNLSLNQLKQLVDADKIEVAYGAMTMQLTSEQLLSFASEAGADGYVSIAIKELNSSLEKYQSAGNVDLTTVSKPFSIEMKPLNALGQVVVQTKALPVTVTLQWKIDEGPSNHLMGLYQLGDKLRYVGGHAEGTSFTANVDQLDNLTLLIYDKSFSDVSSDYWASDYVKELVAKGIIVGKSDGVFDPTGTITRAEYIALIIRTLGIKDQQSQQVFIDVNSNSWYASYVSAAYQAGIVSGKENEKFAPGERITRQEMAVMLVRAYELKSGTSSTSDSDNKQFFTDMKTIQPWAADAVNKAGALSFIHGKNNNKFEPNALTTRAEAAKVIVSLRNQLYKTAK